MAQIKQIMRDFKSLLKERDRASEEYSKKNANSVYPEDGMLRDETAFRAGAEWEAAKSKNNKEAK